LSTFWNSITKRRKERIEKNLQKRDVKKNKTRAETISAEKRRGGPCLLVCNRLSGGQLENKVSGGNLKKKSTEKKDGKKGDENEGGPP